MEVIKKVDSNSTALKFESSVQEKVYTLVQEMIPNIIFHCRVKLYKDNGINMFFDHNDNHVKVSVYDDHLMIIADTDMISKDSPYHSHYIKKLSFEKDDQGNITKENMNYNLAFINAVILAYLKSNISYDRTGQIMLIANTIYSEKVCYAKKVSPMDKPKTKHKPASMKKPYNKRKTYNTKIIVKGSK